MRTKGCKAKETKTHREQFEGEREQKGHKFLESGCN